MWILKSNLFIQDKFFLSKVVDRIIFHPDKFQQNTSRQRLFVPRAAGNSGSLALPGADPLCATPIPGRHDLAQRMKLVFVFETLMG